MKELLLAFIFALIIGSMINDCQRQSHPASNSTANTSQNKLVAGSDVKTPTIEAGTAGPRQDFPDFNSFPNLTEDNFGFLVLTSDKPVFIICYSPNNLVYERMVPLVAALAKEHEDSVKFVKLNILESTSLAQKYEIYTVPSFLVFNKGELTAKLTGIVDKNKLEGIITPEIHANSKG